MRWRQKVIDPTGKPNVLTAEYQLLIHLDRRAARLKDAILRLLVKVRKMIHKKRDVLPWVIPKATLSLMEVAAN